MADLEIKCENCDGKLGRSNCDSCDGYSNFKEYKYQAGDDEKITIGYYKDGGVCDYSCFPLFIFMLNEKNGFIGILKSPNQDEWLSFGDVL